MLSSMPKGCLKCPLIDLLSKVKSREVEIFKVKKVSYIKSADIDYVMRPN